MPATLEDVEALFDAVKELRNERRKMERLSEKARNAPLGKPSQKASADLHWQAFHVNQIEHRVHAHAVNCGIADLRSKDHYDAYSVKLTGFHEYEVVPPKPRAVADKDTHSAKKALADWSVLPKNIYVTSATSVDSVGYEVHCCSVPMMLAPEVRYTRADLINRDETKPLHADASGEDFSHDFEDHDCGEDICVCAQQTG